MWSVCLLVHFMESKYLCVTCEEIIALNGETNRNENQAECEMFLRAARDSWLWEPWSWFTVLQITIFITVIVKVFLTQDAPLSKIQRRG